MHDQTNLGANLVKGGVRTGFTGTGAATLVITLTTVLPAGLAF
jgi:hypothetical protein